VYWREIGAACAAVRAPLLGRYLSTRFEIAPDWYALADFGRHTGRRWPALGPNRATQDSQNRLAI
jgi:hypothetical protein